MLKTSNNKIKIGVKWKDSLSIGTSSPSPPRHPKLIELDPVCILSLYFNLTLLYRTLYSMFIFRKYAMSKINISRPLFVYFLCYSWKIPQTNLIHFALRYEDTHKFVTEQVKTIRFV
jgi:hypothetical protein